MPQITITIVFGFLWWLVFNRVGAGLTYLVILGSVLAVCVCCCKAGEPQWGWWSVNWDGYRACIGRCFWPTLALIIALVVIGILVVLYTTHVFPSGGVLTNILLAGICAPLFVRILLRVRIRDTAERPTGRSLRGDSRAALEHRGIGCAGSIITIS